MAIENQTTSIFSARTFALMLGAILLLGGCGAGFGGCDEEKPMTFNSAADESDGPQYQQPTMEVLQGVEQKFPQKYPLKKYPNSRVVMASVMPKLKPGWKNVVLLHSPDPKPLVGGYYRDQLIKDGWKPVYNEENSAFMRIIYRKGDQEAEVRVSPDPSGNQAVQLLYGPYAPPVNKNALRTLEHPAGENYKR